jgi:hypothetical protein
MLPSSLFNHCLLHRAKQSLQIRRCGHRPRPLPKVAVTYLLEFIPASPSSPSALQSVPYVSTAPISPTSAVPLSTPIPVHPSNTSQTSESDRAYKKVFQNCLGGARRCGAVLLITTARLSFIWVGSTAASAVQLKTRAIFGRSGPAVASVTSKSQAIAWHEGACEKFWPSNRGRGKWLRGGVASYTPTNLPGTGSTRNIIDVGISSFWMQFRSMLWFCPDRVEVSAEVTW